MAFFSKVGNILKQSVSKQISSQISASNPSFYQALRCMSSSKVFVGGLPWAIDDTSLREAFSQYGEVVEARVILDRELNRSRGFGFVTFASAEEASSAISAMDGQDLQGRRVRVNFATDRAPRQFGSGGYGGGGGYGSGSGYGGGQNYGGVGYGGGQNYGGGYGGGAPAGGEYGGDSNISGGADSFFDGGSNVTGGSGFASSGFEEGSGLASSGETDQFSSENVNAASDGGVDNDAGELDSSHPAEGNIRQEDEAGDYAKRA